MGLMNRVLEERTDTGPGTEAIIAPSPVASAGKNSARELLDSCFDQIESVAGGITAPGSLFELFTQLFGIRKGALLIRDSDDDRFKVWADCGLDPTSRSRLTTTRSDISALCPGITASYRADTSTPIHPFLSFREAQLLESVFLVKFRDRSRLAGVLVILESDLVTYDAQSRDMLLAAISEPAARKLVEERETLIDRMYTPLLLDASDFRRSVEDLADSIDNSAYSILLTRISLNEIESMLQSILPGYVRTRARSDAQHMICSLLGGAGDMCIPEPGRIVSSILLHEQTPAELLVGELEERLREQVPVLPDAFSLDIELRHFPHNSMSLDSLLATLVPLS